MTAVELPTTSYDRCPDCSAPTALVATGPSTMVRLDIDPDPAGRWIVVQDAGGRGGHLAVQLAPDTAAAVAAYRDSTGRPQPVYSDHRRPGACPFARPRRPSQVRADLAPAPGPHGPFPCTPGLFDEPAP